MACPVKMVFSSRAEANAHLREAVKRGRAQSKKPGNLRPYRCGVCEMWHLTKQPRKRSASIRRHIRKLKGGGDAGGA